MGIRAAGPASHMAVGSGHSYVRSIGTMTSTYVQSSLPVARMPVVDHVSSMVVLDIGSSPAIISGRPSIHDFSPSRCTHAPAISHVA